MAEKNNKLSPFQKQQAEAASQILEYKLGAEASIVSMIYKNPDLLRETNLELNDIHNNCWRVYFAIAYDMIVNEKMATLSEVDIGLYLEKHSKLADKYYNEYGGYQTIENAGTYIKEENFESYVRDLRKWNTVARLVKHGFPCDKERLSEICDMSAEELYDEYTVYLNYFKTNKLDMIGNQFRIFINRFRQFSGYVLLVVIWEDCCNLQVIIVHDNTCQEVCTA